MLLQPIYEQDFLPCSYGFRPGRSAQQALAALRAGLMQFGGGWMLDVHIRKFFDTLQRPVLRELLQRRIRDRVAPPKPAPAGPGATSHVVHNV